MLNGPGYSGYRQGVLLYLVSGVSMYMKREGNFAVYAEIWNVEVARIIEIFER